MPYERVWIPDLQQWKIIGELTGEEALLLQQSIPFGLTQWGWNAASGVFAYGTATDSTIFAYAEPTPNVRSILIQRPKEYVPPNIPDEYKQYTWGDLGITPPNGNNVNGNNSVNGDNDNFIGLALLGLGSLFLLKRSVRHGKKKSRSKQTA